MKRGCIEHPKVFDLCERLRIRRPMAVGYLEMLWHFTAKYAPQGDIGKYSDTRIEAALDWSGRPGKLVEALTAARWLDRHSECRLVIHDWHEHADDSVRKRLSRGGLQFLSITGKVSGQTTDNDRKVSATVENRGCLPEPEPSQSQSQTPGPLPPIARVMPRAADMTNPPSDRFDEAWRLWPLKVERDAAAQAWLSVVDATVEERVLACMQRFLNSGQAKRGVIPKFANWLFQQHRDGWAGEWPEAPTPQAESPWRWQV